MKAALDQLETKLNNVFEKQAPKISPKARKTLVDYAPWVSLVFGVLTLWAALALWQWAHVANGLIDYANSLCNAYAGYACNTVDATRMSLWVWLGLAVLVVEGVIYLLAFPGLRAHKKAGWNYLFYGALVNVAYAVLNLFTDYGLSNVVIALIGTVVGLWLLFQVRSSYTGGREAAHAK